ncbi:MAG: metalloregulator ArsR/SmtB family transcription factor [Planctomycetes bacterium]|nr:metalloregulator ArsR/SmtB family transcription factor [Planctomycetota bacterium]
MNTFAALADNNRRAIVELLAKRGEMSASAICANFSISPPAVSQHLKVLKEAKVVQMKKDAQKRLYSLDSSGIGEIEDWLKAVREKWNARLDALDSYLLDLHKGKDRK